MGAAGVVVVIWVLLWLMLVLLVIIALVAANMGEIADFISGEFVTLGAALVVVTTIAVAVLAAILGALVGFALGVVNGLLLGILTWAFYRPAPADAWEYRKMAGRVCALQASWSSRWTGCSTVSPTRRLRSLANLGRNRRSPR
ncbi:MAG: hypothetical protein M3N18_10795 [Actinomycetota bacterium]|nr:hypothetical protein [Actinomycetota bacterium]